MSGKKVSTIAQSTRNSGAAKSQWVAFQNNKKVSPFKAQPYNPKKLNDTPLNDSRRASKREDAGGDKDLFSKSFHDSLIKEDRANKTQKVSGLSELHDAAPAKTPSFMMPTKSSVFKGSIVPDVGQASSNEVIHNFHNSIRGGGGGGKPADKAAQPKRESAGLSNSFVGNATQVIKSIETIEYEKEPPGSARGQRNAQHHVSVRGALGATKQTQANAKAATSVEEALPFAVVQQPAPSQRGSSDPLDLAILSQVQQQVHSLGK